MLGSLISWTSQSPRTSNDLGVGCEINRKTGNDVRHFVRTSYTRDNMTSRQLTFELYKFKVKAVIIFINFNHREKLR